MNETENNQFLWGPRGTLSPYEIKLKRLFIILFVLLFNNNTTMGKNVFGGNKSKKFARVPTGGGRNKLRVVEEEGEMYAIVTKMLGNGCSVHCVDDVPRMCMIRGKFQGKGKSTNIISPGSWVLVGLRDWESVKEGGTPKCDLLEVYNHVDKDRLRSVSTTVNWDTLVDNDVTNIDKINGVKKQEAVHFMTEAEQDYLLTMEAAAKAPNAVVSLDQGQGQQIVDRVYVDDI